jgi:hypothetical protein
MTYSLIIDGDLASDGYTSIEAVRAEIAAIEATGDVVYAFAEIVDDTTGETVARHTIESAGE